MRICLVLAGLYQLGACPCGCLDHNGWTDAAAAICQAALRDDTAPAETCPPCDHDHPAPDSMVLDESTTHEKTRGELVCIDAPGDFPAPIDRRQLTQLLARPELISLLAGVSSPARQQVLRL